MRVRSQYLQKTGNNVIQISTDCKKRNNLLTKNIKKIVLTLIVKHRITAVKKEEKNEEEKEESLGVYVFLFHKRFGRYTWLEAS